MVQMSMKLEGVSKALETFDPKIVRKATRSTLDKTATFVKKRLVTLITEKYNMPSNEAKKVMQTIRTTLTELTATLKLHSKRIPLSVFPYIDTKKSGIVVSIHAGKSFTMPHSFVAKIRTGRKGIFKRLKGKFYYKTIPNVKHRNPSGVKRQVIGLKVGPSIPEIVGSEGFRPIVEKEAGEHMERLLIEEIEKRIYK